VDVETEPTLGGVVCDSRVDGNWRSVLRQSTKGTERGYAAGQLYGDVYRHSERRDYEHAADSVHGGIRGGCALRNCFGLNGRDLEQVRIERFAANEQAYGAQLLAGSRVMDVVQLVVKIILC
jgi:hypothetical protein